MKLTEWFRAACFKERAELTTMSWFYGFVLFVSVSIVVIYLLNKYASWRERHWLVLLGTGTGWFLAFAVAVLVPIDISSVC